MFPLHQGWLSVFLFGYSFFLFCIWLDWHIPLFKFEGFIGVWVKHLKSGKSLVHVIFFGHDSHV